MTAVNSSMDRPLYVGKLELNGQSPLLEIDSELVKLAKARDMETYEAVGRTIVGHNVAYVHQDEAPMLVDTPQSEVLF